MACHGAQYENVNLVSHTDSMSIQLWTMLIERQNAHNNFFSPKSHNKKQPKTLSQFSSMNIYDEEERDDDESLK